MIERLPVEPRFVVDLPDQNPRAGFSQSPEALGWRRFWVPRLYLWGSDVETWRGRFREARRLRRLHVQGSSLTHLPEDIATLRSVKTLSILNVNLFEFPPWICEMTQLQYLTVRGTNITHVPDALSKLINLRDLELGNNLLSRFDVDLRGCRKLEWLSLVDNDLDALPSMLPPKTALALAGTPYHSYIGWKFEDLPFG